MSTVSETTQQTLHNLLRVVASGTVIRTQHELGGWALEVNDEAIADDDIELRSGLDVLEQHQLIAWFREYRATQFAHQTGAGRKALASWDHRALLGGRHRLRLELINDTCHNGDGDEAA